MSFVERHALWSEAQADAARAVGRTITAEALETVRFVFPDQHGILRGKTLVADEAVDALRAGCSITTTLLAKDTSHKTVFPVLAGGGIGMAEAPGGGDILMVADPTTFRILPWSPRSGWVLCDLHFKDGRPVPFATRGLMKSALARLDAAGYRFVAGLEVECHLFRLEDTRLAPEDSGQPGTPPDVSLLSHGYQYLTEQRFDRMEPAFDLIRHALQALGLPLRSIEVEYGPSQAEFTFQPTEGLAPADLMILFRSAVKQVCSRNGLHATFMCRPRIPNVISSGWHLHQSLIATATGQNALMANEDGAPLSPLGMRYLAGLLDHARAGAVFTTPTINGYRRYRAYSLAPDRATWACDNRGVMLRVLGGPRDPASRIENRVGEPAANPYLYMSAQIHAGLDGILRALDPGPSADRPYEADVPPLPKSLAEAVGLLDGDTFFRACFGDAFIDYYTFIKRAEIARFEQDVTDWEQREYFDLF